MGDHRDDLDAVRDHYLRRAAQHGLAPQGVRWFTDKMPLNETELGLIGLVFPKSPILHVTRHPLDVMVSVHSTLLTHGHFCGYALETAALHYVRVMDMVDHYRSEMDLRYLNVRYETIIEHQEATVRDVLAFIGEDFEPGCLSFHENRRFARTASYAQVTEKLYDRSRYRYRAYLKELEPIIPILQPVMDRLGYAIVEEEPSAAGPEPHEDPIASDRAGEGAEGLDPRPAEGRGAGSPARPRAASGSL